MLILMLVCFNILFSIVYIFLRSREERDPYSTTKADDDDDKLISFDISADEDKLARLEAEKSREESDRQNNMPDRNASGKEQDLLGIFDGGQHNDIQQTGMYGEFESSDTASGQNGGGIDSYVFC